MKETHGEQETPLTRTGSDEDALAANARPGPKQVIAVMSGKGGVGKSAITMLLAASLRRKGFETGILDADITGPSIPRGLGVSGPIWMGDEGAVPAISPGGIKVISMNLLLPDEGSGNLARASNKRCREAVL